MRSWTGLLMMLTLSSCASTGPARPDAPGVPGDLALSLSMKHREEMRYALIEVERSGQLHFAGGRTVQFGLKATPVMTLTGEQWTELWGVIQQYNLTQAKGSWLPKVQAIEWDLDLRANGKSRRVHCGDDQVPGMGALYDLLFKYQAAVRYKVPGISGN